MRLWGRLFFSLCALWLLWRFRRSGQTDVNDVHVQPREVEKPKEPAKDRTWWLPRLTG